MLYSYKTYEVMFLLSCVLCYVKYYSKLKWMCLASYLADVYDKFNELNLSL